MPTFKKTPARVLMAALPVAVAAGLYTMAGLSPAMATSESRVAFAEMDLDRDGVVTESEYKQYLGVMLRDAGGAELPEACHNEADLAVLGAAADLSDDEVSDLARADLAVLDMNGDSQFTYNELEALMQRGRTEQFLALDTDENGRLTVEEFAVVPSADDQADDGSDELIAEAQEAADALPELSEACSAALDLDGDGADLEAMNDADLQAMADDEKAYARALHAEADLNRDGDVTLVEFLTY